MSSTDTKQKKSWQNRFPGWRDHITFWPVAAGVLALDLWSKWAIFRWFESKSITVYQLIPNFLNFALAENAGAAFGIAHGKRIFLAAIASLAAISVIVIFVTGRAQHKLVKIALALFLAGILGNLYDRLFNNGLVRDFVDVYYKQYHWPAFNVADSALCIAVGLILLSSFLNKETKV